MLIIVMHNNRAYLDSLAQLAKAKNINDVTLVKKEGLGIRLVGGNADIILSKGHMPVAYDMALVAVIKSDGKRRCFLDIIEKNIELQRLNIENKGFICTIPFQYIKHLELKTLCGNE